MSLPTRPAPRYLPNEAPRKIENTKAAKDKKEKPHPANPPQVVLYVDILFLS